MERLFSFRDDPSVPPFDDAGIYTVMDANCGLCERGALWILKNDPSASIRIIPMQTPLGSALLRHYGMSPDDPTSWLLIEDGKARTSLDAIMRTGYLLGGIWRVLSVFRIIPRGIQNRVYGVIARNRYRFFGTGDLCALPDPEVQKRIIK